MHESGYQGITRTILLLGLVSFFTDLSSQVIFPLLPLYLTSILGAGAVVVGLMEGAAESIASFLKVFSGYWSDRMKRRKPLVLLGYGISAVAKPFFALVVSPAGIFVVRIIERIGKGIRNAPRDALVADCISENQRGRAFGFQRAMDGLGSMGGALLAYFLLPLFGYRDLFLLASMVGALALVAILLIREPPAVRAANQKISLKASFFLLPVDLRRFILTAGIFAFGHFGYAFLLLRGKSLGMNDQQVILWYVLFYGVYTIVNYPLGRLSDVWGRRRLLLLGFGLFGILTLLLQIADTSLLLLFIFGTYGLTLAMIDASQRAFTVDLCPEHLRASALGYLHLAVGIAALPGGYLAGLLWDQWGPAATFALGALTSLAALLMMFNISRFKTSTG